MKANYDPLSFFKYLGYYPSDYTPTCKGLRSLSIYVRGRAEQMAKILEPTPFELADDRFVISIADFSNQSHFSFYDAAVQFPVRFGDAVGSTYLFEYEDDQETVASGREKWGYPKKFAHIELADDERGARGRAFLRDETLMSLEIEFDDAVSRAPWADFRSYPHLQARAVSEIYGPGFSAFDIISRDTSKAFELISRRSGRAKVQLSSTLNVGGLTPDIVEILGADYVVGNWASTRENGEAKVIGSLI